MRLVRAMRFVWAPTDEQSPRWNAGRSRMAERVRIGNAGRIRGGRRGERERWDSGPPFGGGRFTTKGRPPITNDSTHPGKQMVRR